MQRLSAANDEIPELRKRVASLEEEQERHTTTVSQMEVSRVCVCVCLL